MGAGIPRNPCKIASSAGAPPALLDRAASPAAIAARLRARARASQGARSPRAGGQRLAGRRSWSRLEGNEDVGVRVVRAERESPLGGRDRLRSTTSAQERPHLRQRDLPARGVERRGTPERFQGLLRLAGARVFLADREQVRGRITVLGRRRVEHGRPRIGGCRGDDQASYRGVQGEPSDLGCVRLFQLSDAEERGEARRLGGRGGRFRLARGERRKFVDRGP
ncbi:MAG: hypothetical protein R3B57_11650 [Phycisphaerales bacterium]